MLSNIVDKIYKSVENNEKFVIPHLEEGSGFVRRLAEDIKKCDNIVRSNFLDRNKIGWITNVPFPITVEVINRNPQILPGQHVHVMMGHESFVIVYYGVCLELENFITVVLWPKVSKTSNQAF